MLMAARGGHFNPFSKQAIVLRFLCGRLAQRLPRCLALHSTRILVIPR